MKGCTDPKEIVKKIVKNEFSLEDILSNSQLIQGEVKLKFGKLTSFFCTDEAVSKLLFYSLNYSDSIRDFEHLSHNASEILSVLKNKCLLDKLTAEAELENIIEYDELHKLKCLHCSLNEKGTMSLPEICKLDIVDSNDKANIKNVDLNNHNSRRSRTVFPFLDQLFGYLYNNHKFINNQAQRILMADTCSNSLSNITKASAQNEEPLIDDLLSGYFARIFINILKQRKSNVRSLNNLVTQIPIQDVKLCFAYLN